jgi:O-methyltransferase
MHNAFITKYFDWKPLEPSAKARFINSILRRLGVWSRLAPPPFSGSMTNVEQRMNMFHLVSQVLVYGVAGDLVEVGCNTGQSAVLFQKIIDYYDPTRTLLVYDSFEGIPDVKREDCKTSFRNRELAVGQKMLLDNFMAVGVKPPVIHAGWFSDTLPSLLPERICFAHLDGDLYDSILTSLQHVYPRLSRGGICLVDDYCDPSILDSWNELPGVKRACDEYLGNKPERMSVLWAGRYSHAFFRKM